MQTIPIIFGIVGLVLLDLASLRLGYNSIEDWDSPEWERKRLWRGFGGKVKR